MEKNESIVPWACTRQLWKYYPFKKMPQESTNYLRPLFYVILSWSIIKCHSDYNVTPCLCGPFKPPIVISTRQGRMHHIYVYIYIYLTSLHSGWRVLSLTAPSVYAPRSLVTRNNILKTFCSYSIKILNFVEACIKGPLWSFPMILWHCEISLIHTD